ncbi:MAG: hypothetical protein U0271_20260 [Polyangiaceae bacterium]
MEGKVELKFDVTLKTFDRSVALVPRSLAGSPPASFQVRYPYAPAVKVAIVDVATVFEPACVDAIEKEGGEHVRRRRFSRARRGNFRCDDQGRVYLNRDPVGRWTSQHPSILLTARMEMIAGKLPNDARVRWSISVPDDSTIEHPQVRVEALDEFRRAATRANPTWRGNLGQVAAPVWEQVHDFTLGAASTTSAETAVLGLTSAVRLFCPDRAGDRFVVEATVVSKSPIDSLEAMTGMLTMWHRIDVQHRGLKAPTKEAFELRSTFGEVNEGLAPARVQLDFHSYPGAFPTVTYAEQAAQDSGTPRPEAWSEDEDFAYSEQGADLLRAGQLFAADSEMFPNKGPGWFTLGAALKPNPGVGKRLQPDKAQTAKLRLDGGTVYMSTPEQPVPQPDTVRRVQLLWNGQFVDFPAAYNKLQDRFALEELQYVQRFEPGDGSIATPDGEAVRADAMIARGSVWARFTSDLTYDGISPPVNGYNAGQVVVFTWHDAYQEGGKPRADFAQVMSQSILHELAHSLGTPHKCGHWAYRHSSGSCATNYPGQPVRRQWPPGSTPRFVPGSVDRMGASLCGLHILCIRCMNLSDNPILKARGW